ncbi:hypothetical protein DPMN_165762 [Dreissena polymorpha]|uniref:Uncharacterized protein n=1 Tax=Dreissena polymorpha TaxID=45954 RepID=A0A9D4F0V7_DREPO|nr:hypothetical protein DPMN_165762 [Dreissena polymorpha]
MTSRIIYKKEISFNIYIEGPVNCSKATCTAYCNDAEAIDSCRLYDIGEENTDGRHEGECRTCSTRARGNLRMDGLHPVDRIRLNHRTAVDIGDENTLN